MGRSRRAFLAGVAGVGAAGTAVILWPQMERLIEGESGTSVSFEMEIPPSGIGVREVTRHSSSVELTIRPTFGEVEAWLAIETSREGVTGLPAIDGLSVRAEAGGEDSVRYSVPDDGTLMLAAQSHAEPATNPEFELIWS